MKSFGSDNHAGIHPRILEAITKANTGHAIAYGDDPITQRTLKIFEEMFGRGSKAFLVFNGTGANVLAIKTLVRSYESVICADTAHIWTDECGAPERQAGCKLIPVATPDGKLTPALVEPHLQGFGFQHHSQPRMISISQPTELGTLYTVDQIKSLGALAHAHSMYLHVDGARLANAVAATGVTPFDMITDAGVDALSFGGTKNGLMLGEAVVFPDGSLAENVMYERKQSMQLASKMRFIAAQFEAYLADGLWLELAAHANRMAARLAEGAATIPEVTLTRKCEANGVFAKVPRLAVSRLQSEWPFYVWDEQSGEVRWMTSFDTAADDVDAFLQAIRRAVSADAP